MANLVPFNRKRSALIGNPFTDFQNMLDDFFADGWPMRRSLAGDTFKVDLQDNEKDYIVEAELPGIQKDGLAIALDEGRLTIAVNKEENTEEKEKNYIHRERRYSSMSRSIFLRDADDAGIKAKLDNGVLTIQVPKKAKPDHSVNIEIE